MSTVFSGRPIVFYRSSFGFVIFVNRFFNRLWVGIKGISFAVRASKSLKPYTNPFFFISMSLSPEVYDKFTVVRCKGYPSEWNSNQKEDNLRGTSPWSAFQETGVTVVFGGTCPPTLMVDLCTLQDPPRVEQDLNLTPLLTCWDTYVIFTDLTRSALKIVLFIKNFWFSHHVDTMSCCVKLPSPLLFLFSL